MQISFLILGLAPWLLMGACREVNNQSDPLKNFTQPDKDMYVIHATVYQVGILTNKTENETNSFDSTGHQESLTFYHSNGSNINLSSIPEPLLTNITAQSVVGLAPVLQPATYEGTATEVDEQERKNTTEKRSLDTFYRRLFKRDSGTSVKLTNGTAVIPVEAGVHSIALPPLLSLNNNLSNIPVPIPNTAIVHYAKLNTLIQKP